MTTGPAPDRLTFDGSCDPNPGGRLGWGWTLHGAAGPPTQGQGAQPPAPGNTVNIAEYQGLIAGLRAYLTAGGAGPLIVQGDSQLIIYQMAGRYGVRHPALIEQHAVAAALVGQVAGGVRWEWLRRSENTAADLLARGGDPTTTPQRTVLDNGTLLVPDSPTLQAAITRLNAHPAPGFGDLARLRVGGRDALAAWTLAALQTRVGAPAAAAVQAAFPTNSPTQAAVLRWALRGLTVELAIQKGRVDLEIQQRAHQAGEVSAPASADPRGRA